MLATASISLNSTLLPRSHRGVKIKIKNMEKEKEKIVGILGGMGPFATLNFFEKILNLTPAKKDWEHLHILIDNNVKLPSRTRAILHNETSPAPGIIESIDKLASIGANFVAVPCNSAHYFYDQVVQKIKIPWLNMIEITSKQALKLGKKPLILGGYATIEKKLYNKYISEARYLSEKGNEFVYRAIEEIKLTALLSKNTKNRLEKIIKDNIEKQGIDCLLFACTELPIVYKEKTLYGLPIIDSSLEYAKETIKFAKGEI